MDHILEHEGQAVPDLSGVSESSAKRSGAMDVDDNEDDQALERLGADASALQDAKVRRRVMSLLHEVKGLIMHHWAGSTISAGTEHQMFRVWQDLQKHRACQLPR